MHLSKGKISVRRFEELSDGASFPHCSVMIKSNVVVIIVMWPHNLQLRQHSDKLLNCEGSLRNVKLNIFCVKML